MTFVDFFTDPVLRAPMWGTIFMCISSSLIGVILFLNKKSLLSETLSHATYPGVVLSAIVLGAVSPDFSGDGFLVFAVGAFITSYLALHLIGYLEKKQKMEPDSVLCFILALFFGVGIVATSFLQSVFPAMQNKIQMLLFGQAATMTDIHIWLYGSLAALVSVFFFLLYPLLHVFTFDSEFSKSLGINTKFLERITFWILLGSLILGIRSVGVVLLSGMIVAPAIAARQFTNHLHVMLLLAAFFGALSGVVGNALSVLGSVYFSLGSQKLALPTGPMIVIVSGLIAFFSLSFSPKRGWVFQKIRAAFFQLKCLEENILKRMWKKKFLSTQQIQESFMMNRLLFRLVMRRLLKHGWIDRIDHVYHLTPDGVSKASSIVRLHRLWELYLSNMLKIDAQKIHKTAEEMEHSITPEIEKHLMRILKNPKKDPHEQPIPEKYL